MTNVPTTDIFPPSKVTDLRAKQFQSEVEITFTAPGDNYDEGNGKIIVTDNMEESILLEHHVCHRYKIILGKGNYIINSRSLL